MSGLDEQERIVVLRILDANANRCAEGLRVIEETARFGLGDPALQRRLKSIRHEVRSKMDALTGSPYRFRDSGSDVGRDASLPSEMKRVSLGNVVRANFVRAEEALRALEEFGKLLKADAGAQFKRLRFELYDLERDVLGSGAAVVKLPPSPFIYAILDRSLVEEVSLDRTVRALVDGGVGCIQYRAKGRGRGEQKRDLGIVLAVAEPRGIPVIVNDDPVLAAEVGAQGVHVGRDDPSPAEARALLGPKAIIGATVHSLGEFDELSLEDVDYVSVGSLFASETKPEIEPVGLPLLRQVKERVGVAGVVAIGGINMGNVESVLDAGVDGIAVARALLCGNVLKNCFTFRQIVDRRMD